MHTIHPVSNKCSRRNGLASCHKASMNEAQLRGWEGRGGRGGKGGGKGEWGGKGEGEEGMRSVPMCTPEGS